MIHIKYDGQGRYLASGTPDPISWTDVRDALADHLPEGVVVRGFKSVPTVETYSEWVAGKYFVWVAEVEEKADRQIEVAVIGPNLRAKDADRGTFHIHKAGCSDINRTISRNGLNPKWDSWSMKAESTSEVAECIYQDMIEEGSMSLEDALGDIYFAPCLFPGLRKV